MGYQSHTVAQLTYGVHLGHRQTLTTHNLALKLLRTKQAPAPHQAVSRLEV
jgi:hypothetical protein